MGYYGLAIFVFFLLDKLISILFPMDFSYRALSFIPYLSFMMLIASTRKLPIQKSLLLALFLGVLLDIYGNMTFLLHTCMMITMVFIAYFWSRNLTDTIFENFIFIITTLFVNEFILLLFMKLNDTSAMNIVTWLVKRGFFTFLFNGIMAFGIIQVANWIESRILSQDDERRRGESVKWLQLRLREEKRR